MKAPSKAGYFVLEGSNSVAAAFYFNHSLFHLRDHHGFTQLRTLWLLAGFGTIYALCSALAGRFAQRYGYFTSLAVGFGGLMLATGLGCVWPALVGQIVSLGIWSVAICFTWPVLEALCSEFETPDRLPDRLGMYNVVWSVLQAVGVAAGGIVVTLAGARSLYLVPMCIHGLQLLQLPRLRRQRDLYVATHHPGADKPPIHPPGGPVHFQTLAWIANPLAYMAANVLTASLPTMALRLHLTQAEAGVWLGLWNWIRSVGFIALWYWAGWHYRFRLFLVACLGVCVGFLTMMLAPSLWVMILGELAFGLGISLVYYSSIFYAMDGSDSHGEQGGTHEALIGLGLGGGPALTALAVVWTGSPASAALAVTGLLGVGIGVVGWVHRRARAGGAGVTG